MAKTDNVRLGAKVRSLRRRAHLTQAQLAEKLGISSSYLNLIENDKRPLTANVLLALAQKLDVDLNAFAPTEEGRLVADLMEAFSDPAFDDEAITNQDVRELVTASPAGARVTARMYQQLREARERADSLASQLATAELGEPSLAHSDQERTGETTSPGRSLPVSPSEDVSDFLQDHLNHFPALETAAERLWAEGGLTFEDLTSGLIRHLEGRHGVTTSVITGEGALRRYDPARRELQLSEVLPPRSRNFQLAHQIALLSSGDASGPEGKLLNEAASGPQLSSASSTHLCRVALANYFAAAVLMPYERFFEAAEKLRYDVELLGHRFRTSFEQVCHRLTTLRRPGREGVPFHLVRVDVAGNISKRFSGSGIRFARYSGACPRWNVFGAFLTPGMIRVQLSAMPDGARFFCIARTLRPAAAGFHAPQTTYAVGIGCPIEHAGRLVYADGVDVTRDAGFVPVGVSCRLCERMDCAQRAFPALSTPLTVDENTRGASFYAPPHR